MKGMVNKMNNTAKTKKRFNFVDVLITAVILAIVAFAVYLFLGNKLMSLFRGGDEVYLRYTVSMSSVEDRYIDYITEGSELHRGDSTIGFIESVKVSEVERIELNERTGELVTVGYPDHKKVDITVVAKAADESGEFKIDKLKIAVGEYVEFKTVGFKSYGYITSFEKFPEGEVPEIFGKPAAPSAE